VACRSTAVQPVRDKLLEPHSANLRGKDTGEGSQWFGFSTVPIVVFNKKIVARRRRYLRRAGGPEKPRQTLHRSGSHPITCRCSAR
jgi:iron(III) transport system substrate-binding protein